MRAEDFFEKLEQASPSFAAAWQDERAAASLAINTLRLRKAKGWSQKELAEEAAMKQPKIAQIERGDANPELRTISRLARALGVEPADLLLDPYTTVEAAAPEVRRVTIAVVNQSGFDEAAHSGSSGLRSVLRKQSDPRDLSAANDNFALAC
jgi:transcriptional regulator with XRE-family HTH domain